MPEDQVLRDQLLALLRGGNAHMDFDEAVDDFPVDKINRQAPGLASYTPWRLLEHIRLAQWDILEFIRNPGYVSPDWPVGYWPPEGEQADQIRWDQTIARFRADRAALENMIRDPNTDFTRPLPHAPRYNLLREILVAADHNAYHIGEFGILRDLVIKNP